MLNLDTERVTSTRDVKWSNKLYSEVIRKKNDQVVYYTASEDDETDEEIENEEGKIIIEEK